MHDVCGGVLMFFRVGFRCERVFFVDTCAVLAVVRVVCQRAFSLEIKDVGIVVWDMLKIPLYHQHQCVRTNIVHTHAGRAVQHG